MNATGQIAPASAGTTAAASPEAAAAAAGSPRDSVIIEGLNHRFGETVHAAADISLTFAPGEFVSIVGPSGCGKTTVLNLLAGLLSVQEGTVSIFGSPPRAGRHDVAYMLARDCLFPWLTAEQNAEFGAEVRHVDRNVRRQRSRDLLEAVGLKGFEKNYPKALSHGMRQRVALARTFCLESPLLLMDEPFGALDAQTKMQLEDVLLSLWMKERRNVVFITHDLAEAITLSDRVIVMSARPGRVIADIPIDLPRPRSVSALQKDPAYHKLYSQVWEKLEMGLQS
ncbi:ABC transporter ATP-binding protein [Pseudohoeflea coraliihabitans]|uniref:ABC transporter ATP-binding protein n=1 Tax=Pseudohoeflea coraliihabitans TaxID=2860393 RepID=A0ABS6WKG6_9HYPH|nr:ABC transporter ATP-binding protein [Pseudohoeflea sp. DP4N28-3]MBW3096437.1 ABC transporter ATP-binding protein [Pseudohoeflea sp. DP4N28-3]